MTNEATCHHGHKGDGCTTCKAEQTAAAVFSPDRIDEHKRAARDAVAMLRAIARGHRPDSVVGMEVLDALGSIATEAAIACDVLNGVEAPTVAAKGRGSKRGTITYAVRKALGFTYP